MGGEWLTDESFEWVSMPKEYYAFSVKKDYERDIISYGIIIGCDDLNTGYNHIGIVFCFHKYLIFIGWIKCAYL